MRRCLDTTFLSDLVRGRPDATAKTEEWVLAGDELVFTAVSWYEVGLGITLEARRERRRELMERWRSLAQSMQCLVLTRLSADIAAGRQAELFRRGSPAPVLDLFIAAIAMANDCDAVVTRDKTDFARIGLLPTVPH